jgi:preprotein translocase subunit SecD
MRFQESVEPDESSATWWVLNLLSQVPHLVDRFLHALPMHLLGLDLRGGVHFMLQV